MSTFEFEFVTTFQIWNVSTGEGFPWPSVFLSFPYFSHASPFTWHSIGSQFFIPKVHMKCYPQQLWLKCLNLGLMKKKNFADSQDQVQLDYTKDEEIIFLISPFPLKCIQLDRIPNCCTSMSQKPPSADISETESGLIDPLVPQQPRSWAPEGPLDF